MKVNIMNFNLTNSNYTLINLMNTTINNTVIGANNSVVPVKDLYDEYLMNEKHELAIYRVISYILAVAIIISNVTVVISSGLILKKGQKPKSTYLLLGNVSLADTIVGFSIIYGLTVEYSLNTNPMCVFQTGILVSPAMVSILSVGLIAVDRYIYILHGLYYQRWFNTTRVRIGITLIWIISLTLGFLPITGWVNRELAATRCIYVGLFPGTLILINSLLSLIPIIVVVVLYTIILVKALKTVETINNTIKIKDVSPTNELSQSDVLRLNRRTLHIGTQNVKPTNDYQTNNSNFKRSASFNFGTNYKPEFKFRTKSIENLTNDKVSKLNLCNLVKDKHKKSQTQFESHSTVCTIESMLSIQNSSNDITSNSCKLFNKLTAKTVKTRKIKEPNKWRAIKVVMFTTASIILTWIPFFTTVIFFVFCEEKLTNPKCIRLHALLGGPLAILAFINSILNPLIYAWWHKGFKTSVKKYYKQYLHKYICRVVR